MDPQAYLIVSRINLADKINNIEFTKEDECLKSRASEAIEMIFSYIDDHCKRTGLYFVPPDKVTYNSNDHILKIDGDDACKLSVTITNNGDDTEIRFSSKCNIDETSAYEKEYGGTNNYSE